MYELKELFGEFRLKKKNPIKNFEVSLHKILHEKSVLTKNAKKKEEISDFMRDLEKNERYNEQEMRDGLQLYINIIDNLRQLNIDTMKEEVEAIVSVFSNNSDIKDDEGTSKQSLRLEYETVLNNIQNNITNVYNILITNESRTSAAKNDEERRVQYDVLLKGYRLIGEIISEKDLSATQLIGNLVLISDLNNYCSEAWKDTLEELMVKYREDVYKILKQGIAITEEKDKIKRRLDKIFFEVRDKVFKDLTYGCIRENMIPISLRPHCLDINRKYLNDVYGFNLGETNLKDAYMYDDLYYKLISMFKKYIENVNIDDLVINQAILKYSEVLNGDNAQKAQNEVVDWSYTYMLNTGLDKTMSRNDFLSQYVYDDMLTGVRKVAIEEILRDKGYIAKKTDRHSKVNLANKVKKALNYCEKEDELDKVKEQIEKQMNNSSLEYNDYAIFMGIIESDKYNECEELLARCIKTLKAYKPLLLKKVLERNDINLLRIMVKSGMDIYIKSIIGHTALHYACENCGVDIIGYLLDRGVEIDTQTLLDVRYTPLMLACDRGKKEIVDYLIKRGANLNIQRGDSDTALIYACAGGYLDIVKSLVENGANIEQTGSFDKNTPLLIAAKKGNLGVVEYLIKNNADINSIDRYGMTPLMCACENGNAEMVKYLMLNGSNFAIRNINLDTALTIACKHGNIYVIQALVENGVTLEEGSLTLATKNNHLKVVEYLISKGANVNENNKVGITPLMYAIKNHNIEMAKLLLKKGAIIKERNKIAYLIKKGAGFALMVSAIDNNDVALVKYLVKQGVKINEKDEYKHTPLVHACEKGNLEIVKYLLEKGALADLEGDEIRSASEYGRLNVVEYLAENGVNTNKANEMGKTAVMYASMEGYLDIVKCLVEHGARLNVKDTMGMTVLMHACAGGNLSIIEYLVGHGIKLDEKNIKQETAVMYAIRRDEYSMVKHLVEMGASIDMQNENGETELMIACLNNCKDIAEYLIEKGANLDIKNNEGKTALEVAQLANNREIIELFEQKAIKDVYIQEVINNRDLGVVDQLIGDGLKLSSIERIYKNSGRIYTLDCILNMYKENNDLAKSIKDVETLTMTLEVMNIDKLPDMIKKNATSETYNKMVLLGLGVMSEDELPMGLLKAKRMLMTNAAENLKSINCEGLTYWAIGSNSLSVVKTIIKSGVILNSDLEDKRFRKLCSLAKSREILDELEKYRKLVKTMDKGNTKNDIHFTK